MTALIFLFMLINFADKVVVGLAAQPIMAELHLTPEQFGLIGSSFFLPQPKATKLICCIRPKQKQLKEQFAKKLLPLLLMDFSWLIVITPDAGIWMQVIHKNGCIREKARHLG